MELDCRDERFDYPRAGSRRMEASETPRMKEQGGSVIMVLSLFGLLWLLGSSPAKIEPVEMPVDGLIEQVEGVEEFQTMLPGKMGLILHSVENARRVPETDFGNTDPQPSPSDKHEKAKREIIIFTRPNCPPCDQWKRCEQPKFEAEGWSVAYCSEHNFGLTPHFSIEKNGKTYDHKGYLPFAKIDEVTR